MRIFQDELPNLADPDLNAVALLGNASREDRAAVYTRPEVVDFILDLVEYLPEKPLYQMRLKRSSR